MTQGAERDQVVERVRPAFCPRHNVVNVQAVCGGVGRTTALAPVSVAVEHNLADAPPRAASWGRGTTGLVPGGSGMEGAGGRLPQVHKRAGTRRSRWFRRVAYSRPTERGTALLEPLALGHIGGGGRGVRAAHIQTAASVGSELRAREVREGLATHTTLAAASRAPLSHSSAPGDAWGFRTPDSAEIGEGRRSLPTAPPSLFCDRVLMLLETQRPQACHRFGTSSR